MVNNTEYEKPKIEDVIKYILTTSPPNIKGLAHKIFMAIACLAAPIASIIYQVIFNCMLLKVKGFRLWYKKLMIKKTVTSIVEKQIDEYKKIYPDENLGHFKDPLDQYTWIVTKDIEGTLKELPEIMIAKFYLYLNKDKVKAKHEREELKKKELHEIDTEPAGPKQPPPLEELKKKQLKKKRLELLSGGLLEQDFDEEYADKIIKFLAGMGMDLSYLNEDFAGSCNAASYNKALARIITIIRQSQRDRRMLINMEALKEIAVQLNNSLASGVVIGIGEFATIDIGFDVAKYGVAFSGAVLSIPVAILESFLRFIKLIINTILKQNKNDLSPKIAKAMASIFSDDGGTDMVRVTIKNILDTQRLTFKEDKQGQIVIDKISPRDEDDTDDELALLEENMILVEVQGNEVAGMDLSKVNDLINHMEFNKKYLLRLVFATPFSLSKKKVLGKKTWFSAFSRRSAGGGRKHTKTKRRKNVKKKRKTTKRKTTKRKTTKRKTTKRKTLKKKCKLR